MPTTDPYSPKPYVELKHPEWSKNATIYEVNIRQYTPEGTFEAFATHLPRLKALGVDILWLMPIHPIGQKNRKGSLGSYYAVQDYYGVNPEFGTLEQFKALVQKIHDMGMYVVIDWVANHTAWDNPLTEQHPEWYTRTPEGNFQPTPWYDWDDIIDLDYQQPAVRQYMTQAMEYWVRETNIDGYRCDVAGFIPVDFWEHVRTQLDAIKPVFMLAEWESRDLHRRAFDMSYAWSLWEKLHQATVGGKGAAALTEYMAHDVNTFPHDAYRMTFTDNHDKNSWEGNPALNFGPGLEAAMVFCVVVNGMPLVYSGQEAGQARSLKFFDKDPIQWREHPHAVLYQKLFALKHTNQALWNGAWGGTMERIYNDHPEAAISFVRSKNGHKVLAIINFSDQPLRLNLQAQYHAGRYTNYFDGQPVTLQAQHTMELAPWRYQLLVQQTP